MNTIAVLAGVVASLWLIVWAFNTIGDNTLGYAAIGLFLMLVGPILLWAVADDLGAWRKMRGRD